MDDLRRKTVKTTTQLPNNKHMGAAIAPTVHSPPTVISINQYTMHNQLLFPSYLFINSISPLVLHELPFDVQTALTWSASIQRITPLNGDLEPLSCLRRTADRKNPPDRSTPFSRCYRHNSSVSFVVSELCTQL